MATIHIDSGSVKRPARKSRATTRKKQETNPASKKPEENVHALAVQAKDEVSLAKPKNKEVIDPELVTKEKWISLKYSEHRIIINIDGDPTVIKFNNYIKELDLTQERHRKASNALHNCGRAGIDIELVKENDRFLELGDAHRFDNKYGHTSPLVKKAEAATKMEAMGTHQLRNLITPDELEEMGLEPYPEDKQLLIQAILEKRTI